MQRQTYEFVDSGSGRDPASITLRCADGGLGELPGLRWIGALAGVVLVAPQIGLAAYAIGSADIRATLFARPFIAVEFALACIFWIALMFWPLRAVMTALLRHRSVEIRGPDVTVVDETPFSTRLWRMPLATYEGISVRLLPSLRGRRFRVVLVHPDTCRSVILMVAERVGDREVAELCRALRLPRLTDDGSYRFGGPSKGLATRNETASVAA
jgi:hypothetical protein